MPNEQGKGFVDYVLWGDDGLPLAVVEAKRTRRDATVGRQQAKLYADCLEQRYGRRPVDLLLQRLRALAVGRRAATRRAAVQGFYTKDELELLIGRRTSAQPLASVEIDGSIVERHYQQRAIRRITEAFEDDSQRKALRRHGHRRRQDAHRDRAGEAAHARPAGSSGCCSWPTASRSSTRRRRVQGAPAGRRRRSTSSPRRRSTGRVYVSTYPTMMGLIGERRGRRGAPLRPGLLRPGRHRRGAPLGLPEVPRDLRLLRLAARRADRDAEGRGRPQHLRPVRPRARRADRRLRPRRGGRRGLPRPAAGDPVPLKFPTRRRPLRRPDRGGEGALGGAGLGRRRRSAGRGRRRGRQPLAVQRRHRRQGARRR